MLGSARESVEGLQCEQERVGKGDNVARERVGIRVIIRIKVVEVGVELLSCNWISRWPSSSLRGQVQ